MYFRRVVPGFLIAWILVYEGSRSGAGDVVKFHTMMYMLPASDHLRRAFELVRQPQHQFSVSGVERRSSHMFHF